MIFLDIVGLKTNNVHIYYLFSIFKIYLMKRLFLASSIDRTAKDIAVKIDSAKDKKLAFITTASEVEEGDLEWLENDRQGLVAAGFQVFDYTITDKTYEKISQDLKDADVIHIEGGNTFYLLLQSRKSGFDRWIKQAIKKGRIYTGSSAGSIIASPNIEITKNLESKLYEQELEDFKGYNLVDFITLPHWGSDDFRELYLNTRLELAYKPENKIILLNDWQYVEVRDEVYRIVEVN